MAEMEINLAEVKYKPPLPPNDYTLAVTKAELRQAQNPNARTGQREWMVAVEMKPMEAEFTSYTIFHNWILTPAALEVESAVISAKKLYEVMGVPIGNKIDTNDFLMMRFVGHTKLESYNGRLNPKLEAVIKPA